MSDIQRASSGLHQGGSHKDRKTSWSVANSLQYRLYTIAWCKTIKVYSPSLRSSRAHIFNDFWVYLQHSTEVYMLLFFLETVSSEHIYQDLSVLDFMNRPGSPRILFHVHDACFPTLFRDAWTHQPSMLKKHSTVHRFEGNISKCMNQTAFSPFLIRSLECSRLMLCIKNR